MGMKDFGLCMMLEIFYVCIVTVWMTLYMSIMVGCDMMVTWLVDLWFCSTITLLLSCFILKNIPHA